MRPLSDALFSPGTMMLLMGIMFWVPIELLYLLPLAWRSRKQPPAYRWGLALGVLPPMLLTMAFTSPLGHF